MQKMVVKTRKWMITLGFLGLFALFCVVRIARRNEWHPYYMAFGVFFLVWIIFWSLEGKLKKKEWNKPITLIWFALCLAMIVSSVLVPKKYFGIGEVLLTLFPISFFVWRNFSDPEALRATFAKSVRLTFLLSSLYSFLFRPYTQGMRYSGFLINPNMLGMYLVTVLCVYIAYLDKQMEKGERIAPCLAYYVEFGLCCFLLFMTQSRTALLSAVFIFGCWFLMRLHMDIAKRKKKTFVRRAGFVVIVVACTFPLFYQALRTIPNLVNRPIRYERDVLFADAPQLGRTAYAASEGEAGDGHSTLSRIWRTFTNPEDDVTTGRVAIYRSYLRELNWTGHRTVGKKVGDVRVAHAHNNFLQMAYTYGITAGILFVLLEVLGIFYGIRYYNLHRRRDQLAFLPFAIVCSFFVMTLTECVFMPFHAFPAFAFWFVVGWLLFSWKDEKGYERGNVKNDAHS